MEKGIISDAAVKERSRELEAAIAACEADIAAVPVIPDRRDLLLTARALHALRDGVAHTPDDALGPLAAALGLRVVVDQDTGLADVTFGEHVVGLVNAKS